MAEARASATDPNVSCPALSPRTASRARECVSLPQAFEVQLVFDHLGLEVAAGAGTTKVILDDVSAVFGPRELVAVMGPSGSGKTTLLNAIFGGVKPTSGSVTINGQQFDADTAKTFTALVPQDDMHFVVLTPYETLLDQTMFKTTLSPSAAKERVEQLLSQFGLQVCKDVRVGDPRLQQTGLSGGQKKRLSVAIELVSNPSLLALDEPTSGLDSVSALVLIKAMKELAQSGATIISTIHQPSYPIFTTFDSLLLLHAGKTCYVGPVDEREPLAFFAQAGAACPVGHNPADFIMDIVSEYTEMELAKLHESATARAEKLLLSAGDTVGSAALPKSTDRRPESAVFSTLFVRAVRKMTRHPEVAEARTGASIGVGLLIGGVFYGIGDDLDGQRDVLSATLFGTIFIMVISLVSAPHKIATHRIPSLSAPDQARMPSASRADDPRTRVGIDSLPISLSCLLSAPSSPSSPSSSRSIATARTKSPPTS